VHRVVAVEIRAGRCDFDGAGITVTIDTPDMDFAVAATLHAVRLADRHTVAASSTATGCRLNAIKDAPVRAHRAEQPSALRPSRDRRTAASASSLIPKSQRIR
jgi:hypothetical protein